MTGEGALTIFLIQEISAEEAILQSEKQKTMCHQGQSNLVWGEKRTNTCLSRSQCQDPDYPPDLFLHLPSLELSC